MADPIEQLIEVEIVYALPRVQTLIKVKVAADATLMQAIEASRILERHPEIDLAAAQAGIFGKPRTWYAKIRDGDRIEIYRPLRADPKVARRARALRANRPNRR